mgnify:CR=1 FL=1
MADKQTYRPSNPPENAPSLMNILSVLGTGVNKAAKFAVRINPPRFILSGDWIKMFPGGARFFNDLTFLSDAAGIPGRGFQTIDSRVYGPMFKKPYVTQYNDINISIINRGLLHERRLFEIWQNYINPKTTYNFAFPREYATQVDIFNFEESGEASYVTSLIDAWPVNVNEIPLNWADDQVSRLIVTFTYKDYKTLFDFKPIDTQSGLINGAQIFYNTLLGAATDSFNNQL